MGDFAKWALLLGEIFGANYGCGELLGAIWRGRRGVVARLAALKTGLIQNRREFRAIRCA